MGFCLFDNIAIAAELAIRELGVERVFIFDWDVHHGNGTAEAFRRRSDVLFVSIHQAGIFPGTGASGDFGSGDGEGYTINLPVPAGCRRGILALAGRAHRPAGRRSFAPGPRPRLGRVRRPPRRPPGELPPRGGAHSPRWPATSAISRRELGAPLGAVLEGGYEPLALAESVAATLAALGGEGEAIEAAPEPLLTSRAAAGVARYWSL